MLSLACSFSRSSFFFIERYRDNIAASSYRREIRTAGTKANGVVSEVNYYDEDTAPADILYRFSLRTLSGAIHSALRATANYQLVESTAYAPRGGCV